MGYTLWVSVKAKQTTPSAIDEVVCAIVEGFRPLKIILFGSRAWGAPRADSDLDLLVILDTRQRTLLLACEIAARVPHPLPLDILVKTPGDVARRLEMGDPFLAEILTRGKVLYETRD